MPATYYINHPADYHRLRGITTVHPLVSIIDFHQFTQTASYPPAAEIEVLKYGCYAVFLKGGAKCELYYGRRPYDFQEGTLVFVAPGQELTIKKGQLAQPVTEGYALLFHPDLLAGSPLAKTIHDYRFFDYNAAEGLQLSDKERTIVLDCLAKISEEASANTDAHSRRLIVSTLQLLLDYAQRFYGRQFHTRFRENQDVISRFEQLLRDYFNDDRLIHRGLPKVSYFAEQLHLSSNYLGDLVSEQLGRSPRDLIQDHIATLAKHRIMAPGARASEVAYSLGFSQPQHFTRFFKQHIGTTPSEYRRSN